MTAAENGLPQDEQPREGVFDAQLSFPAAFGGTPETISTIFKRDGREVPFDRHKIADSIFRAAQSIGGEDRDRSDSLASGVAIYLAKKLVGQTPTVDQVQDAVEKVLMEMGHARTALAFARFRDKEARIRRLRRGDMRAILRELEEARAGQAPSAKGEPASLFVRTSDETLAGWDRGRIADALVRETGIEPGLADVIALEVEAQIVDAGVETLTASLVRELVDAKLIEHGLEDHRRRHRRLGVPLYDVERIISAPNDGEQEGIADPFTTDLSLAERLKKEYALTQVFSQEIADAHLAGDIHLHDLGFVDRLHGCSWSLPHVIRFGALSLGAQGTRPSPPTRPEVLLAHMGRFNAQLRNHVADTLAWDAFNLHLAPFLQDTDTGDFEDLAHTLLLVSAAGAYPYRRRAASAELHLSWALPKWAERLTPWGPGGRRAESSYASFVKEARRFAWAIVSACKKGEAAASLPWRMAPCVHITEPFFHTQGYGEWLAHCAEETTLGGAVEYVLDRDEDAAVRKSHELWTSRHAVAHQVTLNLPRAAYRANDEAGLLNALRPLARLAVKAHAEKRDCIERLMAFKDLGPLSLLAEEREGKPVFELDKAVYHVGMLGLNEAVQALTGRQLHESPEALDLARCIVEALAECCREEGERAGLRMIVSHTDDEDVGRRFATHDLRAFGNRTDGVIKAAPVTQDLSYTPGACLSHDAGLTPGEQAQAEGTFHDAAPGNAKMVVDLKAADTSPEAVSDFVKKTFYRTRVRRIVFRR